MSFTSKVMTILLNDPTLRPFNTSKLVVTESLSIGMIFLSLSESSPSSGSCPTTNFLMGFCSENESYDKKLYPLLFWKKQKPAEAFFPLLFFSGILLAHNHLIIV